MIKIKNVSFGYKTDKRVINNLSLEIGKGKFVAILGHNGSGKSTLAKLLLGLLRIGEGDIFINDIKVEEKNYASIRNICYLVFQNPDNQFVGTTVEDDIAFGLENHRVPHEEMDGLIKKYAEEVGMGDYLKKEPSYLSGGQKQRVAIAGALVVKPKVLILDEATSMLDPKGRSDVLALLNKMKQEDSELTVLFITHDVEEALLADELIVLSHGELKYQGNVDKLFTDEKLLNEVSLTQPFGYKLNSMLNKKGVKSKATSFNDLVDELCK